MAKKRLGEVLVEAGLITPKQLEEALQDQKSYGGRIGTILFEKCALNEKDYLLTLSSYLRMPAIDLVGLLIRGETLKLIPKELAWERMVLPVRVLQRNAMKILLLAMADPTDRETQDLVKRITGYQLKPALALESAIRHVLMDYYDNQYGHGDYVLRGDFRPMECRDPKTPRYHVTDLRSSEPSEPSLLLGVPETKAPPSSESPSSPAASPQILALEEKVFTNARSAFLMLRGLFRLLVKKGVLTREEYLRLLKEV